MMTIGLIAGLLLVALVLNWLFTRGSRRREKEALLTLEDLAALGEVVPETMHPKIDEHRCIGSGACVVACPEKQIIEVVHGQARLVNVLACVGHAACVTACPVDAIKLVFGSSKSGVDLPQIDANFETTRAGLYVIGELSGMGLIRNAMRQGKEAAEHIVRGARRGDPKALDAFVVGAGPAGISATLKMLESGLRVHMVDRESFGGTILHYPRAKVTMTGTLDIPMFGKVSRRKMTKEQLVELWQKIRSKTSMPVETGVLVEGLTEESNAIWTIQTTKGTYRAANVLLALGRRGSPKKLEIPGEDLGKVYYRLLEPREFAGQHVLVVGGGNSAVETALSLSDSGVCASVAISYRRDTFARCRADNRARIDEAFRAKRIHALLPSEVERIEPQSVTLRMKGQRNALRNDSIIVQIGGTTPRELLARFGVPVVTKYGES
jgi:thioredoxin reductase/Pyruvate/2-oxoacid:ferredoxin oxidoreductase delta subunit